MSGLRDAGEAERLYSIVAGDHPAAVESLERVARYASHLLRENGLSGSFRVAGEGLLALDLALAERTFFHEGIVFAALDVFNDPVRNPTVTQLAVPETGPDPEPDKSGS
jgi:hypothetical protein